MANSTQVAKKTEKKSFSLALNEKLISVQSALPKDFNRERFVQNCLALLNDNPQLAKYSQAQLIQGLLKGAYLGLDFFNKECYLIPYGNQLQYQTDYRGQMKLAKKYSIRPIKSITAELVRQGDEFNYYMEDGEPHVSFKPLPFNEDSPVIGAYALVLFTDGGVMVEMMSLKDLENTRQSSKAKNSPAWTNFTGEMYRKTVIHRLLKKIELEFETPEQRREFTADVALENEGDIFKQAEADTAEANSEEFIDADFEEITEQKEQEAKTNE